MTEISNVQSEYFNQKLNQPNNCSRQKWEYRRKFKHSNNEKQIFSNVHFKAGVHSKNECGSQINGHRKEFPHQRFCVYVRCVRFFIIIVCANECVYYLDHIFHSFVHSFMDFVWSERHRQRENKRDSIGMRKIFNKIWWKNWMISVVK